MCNPGAAIMAVQGAGLGMSTVGAFFSAKGEQDALRSQARIAEINARIADSNARHELEQGNFQERQIKYQGTQLKSTQIAKYASSGIDIAGSPSALATITGTDVLTEADVIQTRANATRAAWGQKIEAQNLRNTARSARATAKGISPGMAAATSLIEGAGKVASSWYSLDKQGAFDLKNTPSTKPALVAPVARSAFSSSVPALRGEYEDNTSRFGWGF